MGLRIDRSASQPARAIVDAQQVQRASSNPLSQQRNNEISLGDPTIKKEQVLSAIADLDHKIEFINKRFEFDVHDETSRIVVRIIDKDSEEVIREIPPEKILDLIAKINELVGLLVDEKA
ncbi:MAG: flagellar protein FlaG [Firmicutes bacterium]|jgi:flagellar protein FlaG|nr:flagellar protein FlaG [Bacillota bacterium]